MTKPRWYLAAKMHSEMTDRLNANTYKGSWSPQGDAAEGSEETYIALHRDADMLWNKFAEEVKEFSDSLNNADGRHWDEASDVAVVMAMMCDVADQSFEQVMKGVDEDEDSST